MKKLSLNVKVAFVVVLLIAGSVLISVISLQKMNSINDAVTRIVNATAVKVEMAQELKGLLYLQMFNERSYLLADTPEEMARISELMDKRHDQTKDKIQAFQKIAGTEDKKDLSLFEAAFADWWKFSAEVRSMALQDKRKAIEMSRERGQALRKKVEEYVGSLADLSKQEMKADDERTDREYDAAFSMVLTISIVIVVVGCLISTVVLFVLSKTMIAVIDNLTGTSAQVTGASQQIATSSEELSQAATEQASSLEETVSTLEEMTSMVKLNADNAKRAADLANRTREVAVRGEGQIRSLTSCMDEISADSKKIEDIINVIDDIAFQTNLLALNAAVEAARAGEQGKGFAVVAEAVRGLAQRSASAAKDITMLIKGSVQKIEKGANQVHESAGVLGEIVTSVNKVVNLNSEIASSSDEQSRGLEQIGKAMNQIDQATQINAATSEEAAASAQELSAQANNLEHAVEVLVQVIKGGDSPQTEPASSLQGIHHNLKPYPL